MEMGGIANYLKRGFRSTTVCFWLNGDLQTENKWEEDWQQLRMQENEGAKRGSIAQGLDSSICLQNSSSPPL